MKITRGDHGIVAVADADCCCSNFKLLTPNSSITENKHSAMIVNVKKMQVSKMFHENLYDCTALIQLHNSYLHWITNARQEEPDCTNTMYGSFRRPNMYKMYKEKIY